jgi:ATP-dependent RNA helicase DHX8/PRP22
MYIGCMRCLGLPSILDLVHLLVLRDRRRSPGHDRSRNLPPPPASLPEKPEQYGVYRGRVTNIMDFGCFVELHGLRQRTEGLVHLANISKTR